MTLDNKSLVAYCGLYCDDCFGYKGRIANLAKDLRYELRVEKFDKMIKGIPFKEFRNYKGCYEVLGAMVRLKCKNACRGGGGNPFCRIRKCCQKKSFNGCWECEETESCKILDVLKANHGDAHLRNLRTIKKKGIDTFLEGKKYWYKETNK